MLFDIHIVHFLNAYTCISNSAPLFWDISQCSVNGYYRTHTVKENNELHRGESPSCCVDWENKSLLEKKVT